jgi:hypothetical protein
MAPEYSDMLSFLLANIGIWLILVKLAKVLLVMLFSYQKWMYESRGKISALTKVWSVSKIKKFFTSSVYDAIRKIKKVVLRLMAGRKPTIYSYQTALPYLPVPKVDETIQRVS